MHLVLCDCEFVMYNYFSSFDLLNISQRLVLSVESYFILLTSHELFSIELVYREKLYDGVI